LLVIKVCKLEMSLLVMQEDLDLTVVVGAVQPLPLTSLTPQLSVVVAEVQLIFAPRLRSHHELQLPVPQVVHHMALEIHVASQLVGAVLAVAQPVA
jgi:hypothetical protein